MALPVHIEVKRQRAESLYAEVNTLLTSADAPAEAKAGIEGMLAEADGLYEEVFQLDRVQKAFADLQDMANQEKARQPEGSGFRKFGEYLVAVHTAGRSQGAQVDPRLVWHMDEAVIPAGEAKDLVSNVGASGGFLIPVENMPNVMSVMAEQSVFINRATHIPMRRRTIQIPVLDQTETTAGQPHWFGGVQAYWAAEASEMEESEPKWRQIDLTAHELIAFTRASNVLLDDSAVSLDAFFNSELGFAGALSWLMDYATIAGTGAGKPRGFMTAPCRLVVNRATAGSITYPDLLNMLQRFLPTGGKGVWLASISTLSTLAQINGPSGNPSYVWAQDASSGIPGRLLGYPIVFTEKMSTLGLEGDIALVNPAMYLVGDRQATTVESTQLEHWKYNQTSWRAVARMDGQPWLSAPLTLQDGSTQISPFVILGAQST